MVARKVHNKADGCGMALFCLRETPQSVPWSSRVIIPVAKEVKSQIQSIKDRVHSLVDTPTQDAIITHDRYLQLHDSIMGAKLICIRSALGTGKTEQVLRLIRERGYKRILYLSFRKSFSANVGERFKDIGVLQYSDRRGDLYHDGPDGVYHPMIIVQIEAIQRYRDIPQLVVVDEIEALQSQMRSSIAAQSNMVDTLRRVCQAAEQTIVMDGHL